MLTFGIIVILLAILVLLILFGVRFIRQNTERYNDCHHQKSQTQLPGGGNRQFDQLNNTPTKRSMLDWKCFMSSKSANPHLDASNNRSFNNAILYGGKPYHQKCQTKHSLLLSVKVDVDSQGAMHDHMTKLDADDLNDDLNNQTQLAVASNLPNIICAHNLPPENMASLDDHQMTSAESQLDNRAPMNATNKFGRERQNSIYLSLLPPQSQVNNTGGQQNPNFDRISGSN